MNIICLDLEGVLIPEIWINVAKKFKCKDLLLTTRDIPNYDELMRYRLRILKREGIRLSHIQKVISKMKPLPGAKSFLNKLRKEYPVIILSDTFYEFAGPLMEQLGSPTLFCNWLKVNKKGEIVGYKLRQKDGKRHAVKGFKKIGFGVRASGDSFNDLTMLLSADRGVFFMPPAAIRKKYPRLPVARSYKRLYSLLTRN